MAVAFDPRIVLVTIDFGDNALVFNGDLSIYASGQKFSGAILNECQFKIFNLTADHRNYILSQTSPLNLRRIPVRMSLDVGRQSYGTFRLFDGYVTISGATQPPDIGIIVTSTTSSFLTFSTVTNTQPELAQLRTIAQKIAQDNNLALDFQATDKQINNYSYNGASIYQVQKLNDMGGVIAFVDNGTLVVIDAGKPRGTNVRKISLSTGMVGIPQITQKGITVRMMIDNTVELGNQIEIESNVIPAANGRYIIQKMLFDVASRDQQFYYTLDCWLPQYFPGTLG